jgi:hypothetical protein
MQSNTKKAKKWTPLHFLTTPSTSLKRIWPNTPRTPPPGFTTTVHPCLWCQNLPSANIISVLYRHWLISKKWIAEYARVSTYSSFFFLHWHNQSQELQFLLDKHKYLNSWFCQKQSLKNAYKIFMFCSKSNLFCEKNYSLFLCSFLIVL